MGWMCAFTLEVETFLNCFHSRTKRNLVPFDQWFFVWMSFWAISRDSSPLVRANWMALKPNNKHDALILSLLWALLSSHELSSYQYKQLFWICIQWATNRWSQWRFYLLNAQSLSRNLIPTMLKFDKNKIFGMCKPKLVVNCLNYYSYQH